MIQTKFPILLQEFIRSVKWTYAKTMPEWPHEYIVRDRVNEDFFIELVKHIRCYGYEGKFYRKIIKYFDHDGMTYWTMGSPIEETIIVNRCLKENTFELRAKEGRLPKQ